MKSKKFIFVFLIASILFFVFFITNAGEKPNTVSAQSKNHADSKENSSSEIVERSKSPFGTIEKDKQKTMINVQPMMADFSTQKEREEPIIILPPEKKLRMMGDLDPEYKIRKDILSYIRKSIPKENEKAFKAAIKLAQKMNEIYYLSKNQSEALELDKNESLSLHCLSNEYKEWIALSRGIEKLMRNTKERDTHMWDVDEKYFGWHILGTGLNMKEEDDRCKAGNY